MARYSQALGDSILDSNERESRLSGKSKLTITAAKCLPAIFQTPRDSQTSESAESTTCHRLTSLVADSPVRTSPMPASDRESKENAQDCGTNMLASLASYDPASSSWRTSQLCLDGEWAEFSEIWPRAGMTRNGRAFELPMLVPHTEENESGLWPTPRANDAEKRGQIANDPRNGLPAAVMYPTPTVAMVKGSSAGAMTRKTGKSRERDRLDYFLEQDNPALNGRVNPTWVEWLMGYPLGWTALEDSATP